MIDAAEIAVLAQAALLGDKLSLQCILDALEQARTRPEAAEKALEPFAKMADQVDEWKSGNGEFEGRFDARDLELARSVLSEIAERK